jgi:hypothetical protein
VDATHGDARVPGHRRPLRLLQDVARLR